MSAFPWPVLKPDGQSCRADKIVAAAETDETCVDAHLPVDGVFFVTPGICPADPETTPKVVPGVDERRAGDLGPAIRQTVVVEIGNAISMNTAGVAIDQLSASAICWPASTPIA